LKAYNVDVEQFPGSLFAGSKFPPREEYFKGNPANANAPAVDFSKYIEKFALVQFAQDLFDGPIKSVGAGHGHRRSLL
jgi:hypothetical protein